MNNTENINYPAPKQEYKVLVRCFTFNHSKYIEDALNGFAMQQTSSPFVCLVMDDASTDGEQEVIKAWMERECDMSRAETIDIPTSVVIIVPHKTNASCTFAFYLLKQNLYGTGDKKMNHVYPWRAKCEYEALCEGDDYWIDPLKLQKQVDFMDKNQEYSMCFANAVEHYEDGSRDDKAFSLVDDRDYDGVEFYEDWIIPTATVLFRANIVESDVYKSAINSRKFIHGDIVLFLSCAACGKVRGSLDKFSVYRRHIGGLTFVRTVEMSRLLVQHSEYTPIVFGKQYSKTAKKRVAEFALQGFVNSKFRDWSMFKKSFIQNPKCTIRQIVKILGNKLRK